MSSSKGVVVGFDYDLIVIGSGPASSAAHSARRAGKRVAIVEASMIGGECPNIGCVPTKALLQGAELYNAIKDGERFGVTSKPEFDYRKVKQWRIDAVKRTGTEHGLELFKAEGIDVIEGKAYFLDPHTISVDGKQFRARKFLIATGTKQLVPPIPGLEETGFITFEEAIDLDTPPRSVFVIGAGAIGCEFAHLFNSFGSKVQIADMCNHLIPNEDPEAGMLLQQVFEETGIKTILEARCTRVEKKGGKKVVHYCDATGCMHQSTVDEVLVAAGMQPNTDLGLVNAGVEYDKRGIRTNKYMQTTAPHIYAAGDVVGPYGFTHTASYQSRVAANNMWRRNKVEAKHHAVPRCIFVEPEIACVGLTEKQIQEKRIKYKTASSPVKVLGRANTAGIKHGFVKVLANSKTGKILGATVASPRAGEVVHELTLATQHGLTVSQVAATIHAFPTYSEAVRAACQKLV